MVAASAGLPDPGVSAEARARRDAVQRTLVIIAALNVLVVVVKVVVALRTGSLSVSGAAVESALDAMNNVVAIAIVALAARGPDEDHPYGHDKFETLGTLVIVGFLSISCFELLRNAVAQLVRGVEPERPAGVELALLAATGLVNLFVVWYERRRGKALGSQLLLADAAHTGGDILVTVLAIASLGLTRAGYGAADPWLAIVVAGVIAWSGYQIIQVTVPILVDRRGVDAADIRRVLMAIPGIAGVPSVRSRTSASGTVFADVTITCDGALTVARAHELADSAESAIRDALGAADVTVHVEPE